MRDLFHSRRERRLSLTTTSREPSQSGSLQDTVQLEEPSRPPLHLPRPLHNSSLRRLGGTNHNQYSQPPHFHDQQPSHRPSYRRTGSADSRSSRLSRSQPSTAAMTDLRSASTVPVPRYVHHGTAASRFSDDETSWMSGVESHVKSAGGASSTCSSASKRSKRRPYHLRDGKATKRVIDDLIRAQDQESLLEKLSLVRAEFDHNDTVKHNAELYYGAIAVLSEKLSMTDNHDAIRLICAAMEMAFRGGTKYVKDAFHVNAPNMIPPLLRLLDRCEQSKVRYADEIILNITKIFHYLSRISDLRVSLARQQGLLDSLQRVTTSPLNVPSRNARVRVIANLANCNDNKVLMYAHRGLLTSILKIAALDPMDVTREYATVALMDLASAPANQVPLAKNGQVLRVLTTMVVNERIPSIRESATTTIQNLAFPKSNRLRLVQFEGGLVIEALLSVLQNDASEKTRRRAGGALTNLACEETADLMARHPGLLSTLAQVSIQANTGADVQSRACLALTKIASNIGIQCEAYGQVLDALVVAADTPIDSNISTVFRLRARDAQCRESMAQHPDVLGKLADMCMKPSWKDRENATRAIMHLANEKVNHKIMCNTRILEALVCGASCTIGPGPSASPPPDQDLEHVLKDIQESAIRAMARLATESSNRPFMAKHSGLLVTIAKATERESKLEMQGADAAVFLGKPLLMSLLVAM